MNTYTNSNYDRRKKQEYKGILDEQVREKKLKQNKQRFQTEGEQGRVGQSPRYFSIDNSHDSLKTRKLQEDRRLFPTIQSRKEKHQRSHSYGNELSRAYEQDTDIETMEALAECQIIIENLRNLRLKSLSSMKRKQRQFSYDMNSPQAQGKSNRQSYKGKESLAEQEVMMFRGREPEPKLKKKLGSRRGTLDGGEGLKKSKIQLDLEDSGYLEEEESILPRSIKLPKSEREEEEDEEGQREQKEREDQKEREEREGEEKVERRQKFLLKYLAKAKMRGSKLHEKISHFKNKTVAIPNQNNLKQKQNGNGIEDNSDQNQESSRAERREK